MSGPKTRVLIVENNQDLCDVIEALLNEEGDMEMVGAAHDGIQALEMIERHKPDVVLLDMIMPYLDGLGVLSKLAEKESDYRPKVIVVSAFEEEEMIKRCARLGADYYLLKPFDRENLVSRIRQVMATEPQMARHRADRALQARGDRGRERRARGFDLRLRPPGSSITWEFHDFKGYCYIRDAIIFVTEDIGLLGAVTKSLYPKIAEKHDTTPLIVEAAIRYTIQKTWKQGNPEYISKIFGYAVNLRNGRPPTNSFFIAKIAEELRLEMLEHAQ